LAILDLPADTWFRALGLAEPPAALILEGTWWRARAEARRLALLDDVREAAFPDIHLGRHKGRLVAYACAYGAARAVEPAHVFAQMGTPLLIQIGTCGAVDAGLATGTVAIPQTIALRDGLSPLYGAGAHIAPAPVWADRAGAALARLGVPTALTRHLTWPSLFAQSDAMVAGWRAEGLQSVDMEAGAVAAVAARFGAGAVALLTVWDALAEGRTFLDPLTPAAHAALARADEAVFAAALDLATQTEGARAAA
jgi:purine-nucleoside phosphorylase